MTNSKLELHFCTLKQKRKIYRLAEKVFKAKIFFENFDSFAIVCKKMSVCQKFENHFFSKGSDIVGTAFCSHLSFNIIDRH